MKKSIGTMTALWVTVVACASPSPEHYQNVDELVEAYEDEGGACPNAEGIPAFNNYGEGVKCPNGLALFTWDEGSDSEGRLEELEAIPGLIGPDERYLLASDTWAFSAESLEGAEWLLNRLGGEIIPPGLNRTDSGDIVGALSVVETLEPEIIEVEPADMDERRAALVEQEDELSELQGELEEKESELADLASELNERDEALTATELEIEENTIPGSGTFLVGDEIEPGTYYTDSDRCYWARLSGFSGTVSDINANGNTNGPAYVTIDPSDVAFETNRCAEWTRQ